MKTIKVLGLAMAIVVLTAFAGAGSASANSYCLIDTGTNACPSASLVPTGTVLAADAACDTTACNAGTEGEKVVFESYTFGHVTCQTTGSEDGAGSEASTLLGTTANSTDPSNPLRMYLTDWQFHNCSNPWVSCTVTGNDFSASNPAVVQFGVTAPTNPVGGGQIGFTNPGATGQNIQITCGSLSCKYWGGAPQLKLYNGDLSGRPDSRVAVDDGSQSQFEITNQSLSGTCSDSPVVASANYAIHINNTTQDNVYFTR